MKAELQLHMPNGCNRPYTVRVMSCCNQPSGCLLLGLTVQKLTGSPYMLHRHEPTRDRGDAQALPADAARAAAHLQVRCLPLAPTLLVLYADLTTSCSPSAGMFGGHSFVCIASSCQARILAWHIARRLLPHFIQAGAESPPRAAIIVTELPPPNRTTLQVSLCDNFAQPCPWHAHACSLQQSQDSHGPNWLAGMAVTKSSRLLCSTKGC